MGFSEKCGTVMQFLRERMEFKVVTVSTKPEHDKLALDYYYPSVNKSESEEPELDENPRNIFERFIILLEQAEEVHNSYCEHKIQFCIEGEWRSHFALIPLTQNEENVAVGARVQSLHSEQSQDAGLLPGMLLVSIDWKSVKNSTFDVILALLDEPHVNIVFQETFEEIEEDIKFYNGIRAKAEGNSRFSKTSISYAAGGILDPTTGKILKKNLDNNKESMLTPMPHKAVTATRSSASGKSMSDDNSCNEEFSQFASADWKPRCSIHPVVDLWPRLLQSDEYMIVFQSRPLGVRVRKDRHGNNAIVWKIEGQHAKAAGIEWGSMVYSVNEESVYGRKHLEIVNKLRNEPLPMKIIFWRNLVIADYEDIFLETDSEEHSKDET